MSLTLSQKHLEAGRYAEAAAALPAAGSGADARVDLLHARICLAEGRADDARRVLAENLARFPDNVPTLNALGVALWDAGYCAQAEATFAQVVALQPGNDLARSYGALCLFAQGRQEEAARVWAEHGFCDNVMFRVRVVEHVEWAWITEGVYLTERPALPVEREKASAAKAQTKFYKRDFRRMLTYIPPAPAPDELSAFFGAIAHEMLMEYTSAEEYLDELRPRRDEWPDPLVALNARLLTRRGRLAEAATELAQVLIVGPEDFGVNYYLGVICLAYEKRAEARQYFIRSLTNYMIDTLETQWWQMEQILLAGDGAGAEPKPLQV